MYGATFEFIAARAARYPVIMRRSQVNKEILRVHGSPGTVDPGFQWLLLNTQRINRFLKGTGCLEA
jgi:hypothetical protein